MTQKIPLTKGCYALVDDEDYERISQYKWTMGKDYAIRSIRDADGKKGHGYMHRFILDTQSRQVDHINGNKLDNRRCNLRPCTPSQNQANSLPRKGSSQFKGVSWNRKNARWVAQIKINRNDKSLGRFNDEIDAAMAYDQAAFAAWGKFAYLNFPELIR